MYIFESDIQLEIAYTSKKVSKSNISANHDCGYEIGNK